MAAVVPAIPLLSSDLDLFSTTDPLLANSPILVFYGLAPAIVSASSRIQIHIYTPAGFTSYTRLALSPSSPCYAAVKALPREEQSDEVCRGIAFGLSKYFASIPRDVIDCWLRHTGSLKKSSSDLFSPTHIAVLASRMTRVHDSKQIIQDLNIALGQQTVSWLDIDLVLPPGSIQAPDANKQHQSDDDFCRDRYAKYHFLISAFGEPAFLPTSKVRRAPSKSTSLGRPILFSRHHKESVRKEMCELVDTEASYVSKLSSLLDDLASKIRALDRSTDSTLTPADKTLVQQVFPSTLDKILDLHTSLLQSLRDILDRSETSAIECINHEENTTHASNDELGLFAFANCLADQLPTLSSDYQDYLSSHAHDPAKSKALCKCDNPIIKDLIHAFGEQRLTSTLIEPVQRLPRYTLYIDTIAKHLPTAHLSMTSLMKAKDRVNEICSQDRTTDSLPPLSTRLAHLVPAWTSVPDGPDSIGRLVAIVDVTRLAPPYSPGHDQGQHAIVLICTNVMIILDRTDSHSPTARAFQATLENMTVTSMSTTTDMHDKLSLVTSIDIHNATITECLDDRAISITPRLQSSSKPTTRTHPTVLILDGSHANKAAKLAEEIARARVQGRFTDAEREGGCWDARIASASNGVPNVLSAIFDLGDLERERAAALRIVLEPERHDTLAKPGERGLDILISVTSLQDGHWQVTVKDKTGLLGRDRVTTTDLAPTLLKRLASLLQSRSSIRDPAVMAALVAQHDAILRSLEVPSSTPTLKTYTIPSPSLPEPERHHRPHSPVKHLSSFLHSIGPGGPHSLTRRSPAPESKRGLSPMVPQTTFARPESVSRAPSPQRSTISTSPKMVGGETVRPHASTGRGLEDALSTYLLAFQARKATALSDAIKNGLDSAQDAVDALHAAVRADPNVMANVIQASPGTLIMAAQQFVRIDWQAQHGPPIPSTDLAAIKNKTATMQPVDFQAWFQQVYNTLPARNQGATRSIVCALATLLTDVTDGSVRHNVSSIFVKFLIPDDCEAAAYAPLFEQLVRLNGLEQLLGEPTAIQSSTQAMQEPSSMPRPARINDAGSLASNSSSIRKKLGLTRNNSLRDSQRIEPESRVGSVWRSMSKTRSNVEPSTFPRSNMQRAKSVDVDTRLNTPKRSSSQDRPSTLGAFAFERPHAKESHTFMQSPNVLGTIGEGSATKPSSPRRTRRSSLSDVAVDSSVVQDANSPIRRDDARDVSKINNDGANNGLPVLDRRASKFAASPVRVTSSSKVPTMLSPESVARRMSTLMAGDENAPATYGQSAARTATSPSPSKLSKRHSVSLRTGLTERQDSGNAVKVKSLASPDKTSIVSPLSTPTRKLKMQSPQKLRERLQYEQKTVSTTQTMMQEELDKLGNDLSSMEPIRPLSVRRSTADPVDRVGELSIRVSALQETLASTMADLTTRSRALQADFASSLAVSENKSKSLDALYREANAENEALYGRFNDELGKVVKAVRGGVGVEELKQRVKDGNVEQDRLRRENARLKREVVGLRSQLRE